MYLIRLRAVGTLMEGFFRLRLILFHMCYQNTKKPKNLGA